MINQNTLFRFFATMLLHCGLLLSLEAGEAHKEKVKISGQVFIKTEIGANIKLSLVEVGIYDANNILKYVESKRLVARPIKSYLFKKWEDLQNVQSLEVDVGQSYEAKQDVGELQSQLLRGEFDYCDSVEYYYKGLPSPIEISKTDADGLFQFTIEPGNYVLVSSTSRSLFLSEEEEFYSWMVIVEASKDVKVLLANDNLTSSGSSESVIQTPPDEEHVRIAMRDRSMTDLIAWVESSKLKDEAKFKAQQEEEAAKETKRKEDEKIRQEILQRQRDLEIFEKNPQAAKAKAIEMYPELGVVGSDFHRKFMERGKWYQDNANAFFTVPDWPIRLAKECSELLKSEGVAE